MSVMRYGLTRYGKAALDRQCAQVRDAVEGERNVTLAAASTSIGRLVPHEIPHEVAFDHLMDAGISSGLSQREIRPVIRSGIAKGQRNPKHPEPGRERPAPPPRRRRETGVTRLLDQVLKRRTVHGYGSA